MRMSLLRSGTNQLEPPGFGLLRQGPFWYNAAVSPVMASQLITEKEPCQDE